MNTTRVSRIRLTAAATRELPRWLLLAICVIYGLSGLFSRDPWKNEDAAGFGAMWTLATGNAQDWLMPNIVGRPVVQSGPLVFWIDGAVGQREAVDKGSILAVGAGTLDVAGVDLFELGGIATDSGRNMQQRAVLLRSAGACHAARGSARLTADQGHVFVDVELLHDDRDRQAAGNSV